MMFLPVSIAEMLYFLANYVYRGYTFGELCVDLFDSIVTDGSRTLEPVRRDNNSRYTI